MRDGGVNLCVGYNVDVPKDSIAPGKIDNVSMFDKYFILLTC